MTVDVIDADDAYSIAARDVFWLAVLREQLHSSDVDMGFPYNIRYMDRRRWRRHHEFGVALRLTFTGAIKMALKSKEKQQPEKSKGESCFSCLGEGRIWDHVCPSCTGTGRSNRDATQAYQLETKYARDRNAGSTDGPSGTQGAFT
jgi:hypothetical protein